MPGHMGAAVAAMPERKDSRDDLHEEALQAVLDAEQATQDAKAGGLRELLGRCLATHTCEAAIGSVIVFNMCLVVIETQYMWKSGFEQAADVIEVINNVLLVIYIIELTVRLYVFRCSFFFDAWNVMDFSVVSFDVVLLLVSLIRGAMPQVSIFRIFRLLRLLRTFRAARMLKELNLLIRGFLGAVRVIFWGLVMVFLILTVFSILAVQLVHPVNVEIAKNTNYYDGCERCEHAFEDVWLSVLTFFQQIVAGDSWGTLSLPLSEEAPWTFVFFLVVLVVVNLAMLNLILAVIVEAAQSVKAEDEKEEEQLEEEECVKAQRRMLVLCEEMDEDKSGMLTLDELRNGFDNHPEFREMCRIMRLAKTDLDLMFQVLDGDGSGDVCYEEFVEQLHRAKNHTNEVILLCVAELRQRIRRIEEYSCPRPTRNEGSQYKSSTSKADLSTVEAPPLSLNVGEGVAKRFSDHLAQSAKLDQELLASLDAITKIVRFNEDVSFNIRAANLRCNDHSKTLADICNRLTEMRRCGAAAPAAASAPDAAETAPGARPAVPRVVGRPQGEETRNGSRGQASSESNAGVMITPGSDGNGTDRSVTTFV